MRNIKLLIEYDGTDFVGWQSQRNGRSVQDVITDVLRQVLQEQINLHGAGRTDSGVHARGQVANCHIDSLMPVQQLLRALNGVLPVDIRVRAVDEVAEDFHARFSAKERLYRYVITSDPVAIGRQYQWFVPFRLNLDRLNNVTSTIEGEHDFGSFCKSESVVEHHRCIVVRAAWVINGSHLVFQIRANRFLHGMVRALVGTMVDVGRGSLTASDFQKVMEARDRREAGMAAPPHGLFLEEVVY